MRTNKENRWASEKQKKPEVCEVSLVNGCGCRWWKRYVFSTEWKWEGVMDDDSGDDKSEED